jgi:hypothetical protein
MTSFTKWLILAIATLAFVTAALLMSHAADDAAKVSELEKLKIINAYQAAVIAQVDAARANEAVQKAIGSYNAVLDETRKAHAWPDGTKIELNGERTDVTVVLPTKPADAAPPPVKK